MTDRNAMFALIGVVLVSAMGSSAWLVSNHAIDPQVFAGVVGGSVAGVVALLNPIAPRPPSPPAP